ncbi:MAG TPA: glycosyltransferase family 39 protein [Anaerolineae bacterium]|nr:glycosyltransferase family 39 protein [Anaerolineae bacterium]
MNRLVSKVEFAALALIVVFAAFFRVWRLAEIPGGLTDDEALWGYQATRVANGEIRPIFFEDKFGREPSYGYLVAALFKCIGPSILAVRAAAVLAGIATIPVFYLLVKELFPNRTVKQGSLPLVAILATSWLATSYWHLIYSRSGIAPILLPLAAILSFYFLWRGVHSGRLPYFLAAGIFVGWSVYTYQAGRFIPILAVLFLLYLAWRDREFLRNQWANMVALFVAALLVVLPLALYGLQHPDVFLRRAEAVSIFNPEFNQGGPINAFGTAFVKAIAAFTFEGDHWPERNPGSRPILDPLTSILCAVGLCIAVMRFRRPEYAFLCLWLLVMTLPATLTISEIPNFTRGIGALPAVAILPAIAVVGMYDQVESRMNSRVLRFTIGVLVFLVPLLFAGVTTWRDYFGAYDRREDLPRQFDLTLIEAANVMNQIYIPDSVWIWPTTSLVSGEHIFSHPDFLYYGKAPYRYVSCDDDSGPEQLTAICRGATTALVLDWKGYVLEKAYEAIAADPKNLISFLFQKYGRELNRRSYEAFDVVTYQVPESPTFSIAEEFEPLAVNFGHELMLTGVALGGSSLQDTSTPEEVEQRELPSGKNGWVVLRWQAQTVPSGNYKVAVYLQDQGGHVAGQTDKLLLSNYLHPTQDWQVDQEEIDYYTLPAWPATAPGQYTVGVTLYDAETMQVVPIAGGAQWHQLGSMEIVRPLMAAEVQPQTVVEEDEGELAPGIRLLGYDFARRDANPGEELSVALYWQALEDLNRDYLIAIQLTDDQGDVWAESFGSPVYGTYPTTQWAEREVLKDWHDVSLPRDIPQGDYQVLLRILGEEQLLGQAALGPFQVHGRARVFSIPDIQHPVEATLGEAVRFLGYDLGSTEVKPGDALQLTLYWQALEEMEASYTVFTHLLDADNQIWGQRDSVPCRGEAPTTSWVKGEIITDEYDIVVDPEAPAGEYVIEIGMYDAGAGKRAPVVSDNQAPEQDRVLLGAIHVLGEP